MVERANQLDQVHAVDAIESMAHEHRIVLGSAAELFTRALAVAVPGHVPAVAGEDIGKQFRHTFVPVRDKDRLQGRVERKSILRVRRRRSTANTTITALRAISTSLSTARLLRGLEPCPSAGFVIPACRTCIPRSKNTGGSLPVSL